MQRTNPQSPSKIQPPPPVWAPWLTQAAFVLMLILVVARVLMSETVREAFDMVAGSLGGPTGPGPTTTLVMDAICCVPALLVLLRRAVDRQYVLTWTWSQVLLALLAGWSAASVLWSTDKFVTVIAAANFIAAAVMVWSAAQLVRSWLRLRIVAGVCLGLLMACWAHGLIYRYFDYPDNIKFWKEHREQIFAEQGWEPDSFEAMQFEKKLLSGEVVGFTQSANSFAAVIVLLMVVSAGVAIQRTVHRDGAGWAIVTAGACVPALLVLYFTNSRTAAGTLLIAGASFALLGVGRVRAWLVEHPALAYWTVAAISLIGAAALIGHGVYHGSLPQDSLNFRWRYWVAAARLVRQHPLAGVGWGNFGPHYLSVRLPAAAEEVHDPHNFLVRCFAELGWIGGVLALAWVARAAWELTRPIVPRTSTTSATPTVAGGFAIIVAVAAGGIALNLIAAVDWSQPAAFLLLEVFRRVLWLGLLLVGLVTATIRSTREQRLDDRPAPWVLYGLLIALGVFFVHGLMDFVLAEPGAMTLFAVLLGAGLGVRTPPPAQDAVRRRGVALAVLAVASIVWIYLMIALVLRVADAEQLARDGDDALTRQHRPDRAAGAFANAFRAVPFNADYAYRQARALIAGGATPEQVRAALDVAMATDPANVTYRRTRADYEMSQSAPDAAAVRADFDRLLALDPKNLSARLRYAEVLEKLNDPRAAAEQYRKALETSNGYDVTEPKRLSAQRVSEIENKIKALEGSSARPS
jgi:O-antigen ligase